MTCCQIVQRSGGSIAWFSSPFGKWAHTFATLEIHNDRVTIPPVFQFRLLLRNESVAFCVVLYAARAHDNGTVRWVGEKDRFALNRETLLFAVKRAGDFHWAEFPRGCGNFQMAGTVEIF